MPSSAATEIDLADAGARALRSLPALLLDGCGFEDGWGPFVALSPRVVLTVPAGAFAEVGPALLRLDRLVAERRRRGGCATSGLVALLSYELFLPHVAQDERVPRLVVLSFDASLPLAARRPVPRDPPQCTGELVTSLPRERYVAAARRALLHIRCGDIYQANLTQRFEACLEADPLALYEALACATPAPRAALIATGDFALASVSPELFLRVDAAGHVETWPIKGTRARGATSQQDAALARSLLDSEKDRAELTMIVDLERNDLGRVCVTGSVRATEPMLRSFAAVHHLVARVSGTLRSDTTPSCLLRAVFPGGSITGAPKIRAQQILRELEPVARGYYTGSLFFFADDGSIDSSILIRSAVLAQGRVSVGAGGAVVADSDPEGEWRESNHKARALLSVLGRIPEDAR